MNILNNRKLMERLTAEYVLGTLRGPARRRYETLLASSPALKEMVMRWENHLHPMAQMTAPVSPPTHIWPAIERKLGLRAAAASADVIARKRAFWLGLREDLSFWRGLGMVSTALAMILLSVLLSRQVETTAPAAATLAMLSDDKSQPVAVVTTDAERRLVVVKVIAPQTIAANKSLELWVVPKEGAPRSLGLIAASGTVTLPWPENATPQNTALLAISLEPKGGSPNPNAPSGPIVFKGPWVQI